MPHNKGSITGIQQGNRVALMGALLSITVVALYFIYCWVHRDQLNISVFLSCRRPEETSNNSSAASPCVYFRPTLYFFESNSSAFKYNHIVEESDVRWSMWGKQVSTYHNPRGGQSPPNKLLQQQGITSISTIMMPKVASRSIEALFNERLSVQVWERQKMNTKGARIGIATPSFWRQLAERQQSTLHDKDIIFSLLRDPVSRFLSSLAQTLSLPMQRRYKACKELWKPCLEVSNSYKQLVKCAINSMKQRQGSPYFDAHMVPQGVFLAGALHKNDVEIAIFSINDLEILWNAFGASQQQPRNTREEKEFSQDVVKRFGEELLSPRQARTMLDDDMVQDVCEFYAMDVSMMHHLGFSAGDCD